MDGFTIGIVAKMTGLTTFTLRAWERRYNAFHPNRSDSGRRLYTSREVERLKALKLLTESGHAIGDIAHLEMSKLNSLLLRSDHGVGASKTISLILSAVADCDLPRLSGHLRTAQLERDTRSLLIDVISPVLSEIGSQVESGELDIYHEHAASALIRNLLLGILYSVQQSPSSSELKPIIFVTPEGDHHEFGILMSAILAALRGFKVYYLGPNLPVSSLVNALKNLNVGVVVVGCTAPPEVFPTTHWKAFVRELLKFNEDVSFWFGGSRIGEIEGHAGLKERKALFLNRYQDLERALTNFKSQNSKMS